MDNSYQCYCSGVFSPHTHRVLAASPEGAARAYAVSIKATPGTIVYAYWDRRGYEHRFTVQDFENAAATESALQSSNMRNGRIALL